jgi:putative CocE/NonD family hydrolase
MNFGPAANVDFDSLYVPWFAHWLKGENNPYMNEPPVRLFVMGDNQWRSEREWPLARTQFTKYYIHSEGRANGAAGDGVLDRTAPKAEPPDRYTYDPNDPVPTVGGNLMFNPTPPGPFDQAVPERRGDVLVYTTAPLTADVEVTGPITMTLYAASSARDTDFAAKLVDVYPDGKAINLGDGIIRARYRESPTFATEKLLEPGMMYEYTIDLWATSNVFKRGHRIRVDVSSSNFPKYDRNLNTGNVAHLDTQVRTASQTIYHDAQHPSAIILPVIPR